jgi:hypothetical protein
MAAFYPIAMRRLRVTFLTTRQALTAIDALARLADPPRAALVPAADGGIALVVGASSGRYGAIQVVLENLGLKVAWDTPSEVALLPLSMLRTQLRGEGSLG